MVSCCTYTFALGAGTMKVPTPSRSAVSVDWGPLMQSVLEGPIGRVHASSQR